MNEVKKFLLIRITLTAAAIIAIGLLVYAIERKQEAEQTPEIALTGEPSQEEVYAVDLVINFDQLMQEETREKFYEQYPNGLYENVKITVNGLTKVFTWEEFFVGLGFENDNE